MNSTRHLRGILFSSATLMLAGAIASAQTSPGGMQPQQSPSMPPTATAGSPADAGMPNPQALDDQAFLRKALEGDQAEVELGQLAQQKSQSPDVKQFAEKMVQDHTQLSNKVVEPVAQQLSVKAPKGLSKKDRQLLASLQGLSGAQFDQEYIRAMVKDHQQDLKDFKSEAEMTQNPNVKQVAEEGATLISQHLQLLDQIAQKHNVEAKR